MVEQKMKNKNETAVANRVVPEQASGQGALGKFAKRALREGIMNALPCVRAKRLGRLKEKLETAMKNAQEKMLNEAKVRQCGVDAEGLKIALDYNANTVSQYPMINYVCALPDASKGFFTLSEIIGTRSDGGDGICSLLFKSTVFAVMPSGETQEIITETACIYEFCRLQRIMDTFGLKAIKKIPGAQEEYGRLNKKMWEWRQIEYPSTLMPFAAIGKDGLQIFLRDGRFRVSLEDAGKLKHDEDGRLILDPALVREMVWGEAKTLGP